VIDQSAVTIYLNTYYYIFFRRESHPERTSQSSQVKEMPSTFSPKFPARSYPPYWGAAVTILAIQAYRHYKIKQGIGTSRKCHGLTLDSGENAKRNEDDDFQNRHLDFQRGFEQWKAEKEKKEKALKRE
jgi:hypothetical protein